MYIMEVIIKKSNKPDKKIDAVIDNKKKLFPLVLKVLVTSLFIKILSAKLDTLPDIRLMKTGLSRELKLLGSTLEISFGISLHYKHQLMI